MRKAILYSLTTLFLLTGCSQKKANNVTILSWGTNYFGSPEVLNGKVKEIKKNSYWAVEKNGSVEKGAMLTLKEHNDNGFMQDFQAFYNDSGVLLRNNYLGDNSQILISYINELENGIVKKENWIRDDSIYGYALFNYDTNGFITDVPLRSSLPDSSNGKLALTYDEKGNMTQMKVYNSRDIFTNRTEFKWNESGRMTQSEDYLANDSLQSRLEITYNDHGFFDQIKAYDGNGKTTFDISASYTYDKNGNWIKAVYTKTGKSWIIDERTYVYY